jgi:hypothetical protein
MKRSANVSRIVDCAGQANPTNPIRGQSHESQAVASTAI